MSRVGAIYLIALCDCEKRQYYITVEARIDWTEGMKTQVKLASFTETVSMLV